MMNPSEQEKRFPQSLDLVRSEQSTVSNVDPLLARYVDLCAEAHNALAEIAAHARPAHGPGVTLSSQVLRILLTQLVNDLRGAVIMALHGYGLQAMTLVASVFEGVFAMAYIDADDDLAREWLGHQKVTRGFRKIKELVREGLTRVGVSVPDGQADRELGDYAELCMAKHVNPILQRDVVLQRKDTGLYVTNGPNVSEPGIRTACRALTHGVRLSVIAGISMVEHHVKPIQESDVVDPLDRRLDALTSARETLDERAVARWATRRAFSGISMDAEADDE